tara:strand:- start:2372 stop:3319 length:948 start_codon:yes stop_codon:yes gene_type:complete
MYSNILLLGKIYEDRLNAILDGNIAFILNIGGYTCMARIPDFKNSPKSRFKSSSPNINKRCVRPICNLGLCKIHLKNLKYGKVDEYPNEEMIYHYRKKHKNIEATINLNHDEFNGYIKLKRRKILNVVIRMSVEKTMYKKTIKDLVIRNNTSTIEGIYENVISENNIDRQYLTINEKNKILEDIDFYKSKNNNLKLSGYIRNIDVNRLNSIKIRDDSMNCVRLFKLRFNDINYLINSNKKFLGTLNKWIDEEDLVPKEYKTSDDIVLHPLTNLPIIEVELNFASEIYSGVAPGIYREYNYDDDIEAFMSTNNILL